jgi:hypothetical protein
MSKKFSASLKALLVSLIVIASPAQASHYWTGWTSEEYGPRYCNWDEGAAGFACSGRYCDNVSLACLRVPWWTSLNYSTTYWSNYFSEEGNDLRLSVCPLGSNCDDFPAGRNFHSCFNTWNSNTGILTGIRCRGSYCDDISLECTKPTLGKLTNCWWSAWLSEEQGSYYFGANQFVTAVECEGRYCDNKSFRVCSLVP